MRLLITADLHFNNARSAPLARDLIAQMNAAGGDVLLLVGDTAAADGDSLEKCLGLFRFAGPKLFVAGNHELWSSATDSREILGEVLPRRVAALGWHWLQGQPFETESLAIVGNIGWYDYSFAEPRLEIPERFYARKISPGAAERFTELSSLFVSPNDPPARSRQIVARWNDGRFIRLGCSDPEFLAELLATLSDQLEKLSTAAPARPILAAIHHLPFAQLLPPSHSDQWDFSKAYLGSAKIGELLSRYPQVTRLFCGHSHFPAEATIGHIKAVNIGSGYGNKRFLTVDVV